MKKEPPLCCPCHPAFPLCRDSRVWLWDNSSKEQLLPRCKVVFSLSPGPRTGTAGPEGPGKSHMDMMAFLYVCAIMHQSGLGSSKPWAELSRGVFRRGCRAEEDEAAPGSEGATWVVLAWVYFLLGLLWLETFRRKGLLPERDSLLKLWVLRVLGACVQLCVTTLQALHDQSWTCSSSGRADVAQPSARTLCSSSSSVCHGSPCAAPPQHLAEPCSGCRMFRSFGNLGWTWRVTVLKQLQLAVRSQIPQPCPGQGGLQDVMPSVLGMEREHRCTAAGGEEETPVWRAVEAAGDEGMIREGVLGFSNADFIPCFSLPGAEQEPGTHCPPPHCPEGSAPHGEATKAGGNPGS